MNTNRIVHCADADDEKIPTPPTQPTQKPCPKPTYAPAPACSLRDARRASATGGACLTSAFGCMFLFLFGFRVWFGFRVSGFGFRV